MSKPKPTYRITPPGDRLRIWGAVGRALAVEPRGWGGGWIHAYQTKDESITKYRPETLPPIRGTDYKEPIAVCRIMFR